MALRVDVWSDVVCPWCYIGKRRLERALEGFPHRDAVEVVHRAFQLDPSAPRNRTQNTVEHLAEKYGTSVEQAKAMQRSVTQVAAGDGLEYHLDRTLSGNTFDAHRVLRLARASGREAEVLERLYRAYFTEGQSIFDAPSLVRLAAEAGLDAAEVGRVLAEGTYADEVEADRREAGRLGANGVPFFVVGGRYGISGAQPRELFEQVLQRAWADAHPSGLVEVGGEAEACTDESCAVPETGAPARGG
jgi:predicted DsbA family dithiol-disulfide isomerase